MIFGGEAGLLKSDGQTICNHHLLACLLEIKSILHIAVNTNFSNCRKSNN